MKIAVLASGTSIHSVRWVNALAARGFDLTLFSLHGFSPDIVSNVHCQQLPVPSPPGYVFNVPWLRTMLRRMQPAMLHTHCASGYGTLGRLSGFHPHILSVWGSDVFRFPERSSLHRRLIVNNLTRADWVCSTSYSMADRVRQLCPTARGISVIPFGIDLQKFRRSPESHHRDVITVGTVKWLHPVYGIDVLIQAFAKCRTLLRIENDDIERRMRLLLVGSGTHEREYRRLAARFDVADVTEFRGAVDAGHVPNVLREMDVFVVASRSESFGVSVLEASACGIPALVTNVGGLPEVVQDGRTGLIVPPESPELMAQAMKRLVVSESLRRHFARQGTEYVRQRYDWTHSVDSMERLYHERLRDQVTISV